MIELLSLPFLRSTDEKRKEAQQITSIAVAVVASILAAYLSWSCNTARNIAFPEKVLYSFFAFMFGTLYLVLYWIFNHGYCSPMPLPASVAAI
jgi:hypothetical protein